MIRLHFGEVECLVEFSFFAVAALVGTLGGVLFYLQLFSICALHEFGHLAMMALLHIPVRQIRICGAGVSICPATCCAGYGKDIVILLAGPCMNLVLGTLAWRCGAVDLAMMHGANGLFTLLPYSELDGGSILLACCGRWGCMPETTARLQKSASVLTTLTLLGLFYAAKVWNPSLLCMLLYLQAATFLC